MNKIFFTNIKFAFLAQAISLGLSVLMSLVVPKILGVEMYGYWQLFMFYIVYTNLFHFGICDGIYLRIGGKKYSELDYKKLGVQFYIASFWQVLIAIIIIFIGIRCEMNDNRAFVIISISIYMLCYNAISYFGMIFQAVNETKKYSISVIIDKVIFIIFLVCFIIIGLDDYKPLIISYIFAALISLLYLFHWSKDILISKPILNKEILDEIKKNIGAGMPLMLSAFTSNFIVGAARATVDNTWGITAFGKFSFAISMTNFFLLFIRQISIVLFPTLRQESHGKKEKLFYLLNETLNYILPLVFLIYYPANYILSLWLPQYQQSLTYLALLIPLCIYDGKTQMLFVTYMKDYRKERVMLLINIISVCLSILLSLLGAHVFRNLYFIILSIVIVVAIRAIILEWYVSNKIYSKFCFFSILEQIFLVVTFVYTYTISNKIYAFCIFLFTYSAFLLLNKKNIHNLKFK